MDELPYVKVRHEGKRSGEEHLGRLKCSRGSKSQQDKFLLTTVYSEKRRDGSWFTDHTYTYNGNGWDTEIYQQAYKISAWQRFKAWWFNG